MEKFLEYFTPKTYKISLEINKHKKTRKGKVEIFGHSKTDFAKFHCVSTEVDYVRKDGQDIDFQLEYGVLTCSVGPESDFTIEIGFHGSLNENMQGAYLSTYKVKNKVEKIVSTQFESHYARECFPCIDEPAAKATFDLEITIPKEDDDLVISNMPIQKSLNNTTIFETTPKMSTYLLAFVIGKFQKKNVKNSHGIEITTYIPLNQSLTTADFANEIAAKSLDFYDNLFGTPYPLKKLDQVAIPDFEAGAMENWGIVTYRESCLLADEKSSLDTKKSVATTISHELSHQWFGNLVTMEWWNDLWLNESFASVMEYYAIDDFHPEYNVWEDFFTGNCLSALRRDSLSGVQSVKQEVNDPAEIATLFDSSIVYAKGARLMLMLIRMMGKTEFFSGIKAYFEKYAYQNTIGDNLWDELQPFAKFNVKKFMNSWISQSGYPVLTDGIQQRFLVDGSSDETTWPLPEISDDMAGHYLLNLSGPEFKEALDNFGNLSLEQKLRLLIDRMLLAKTPLVSSSSLIDILLHFKDETSAPIWDILLSVISDLKLFFMPETKEENRFKDFLNELISPNLSRLGLTKKPNESDNDTRLRNSILSIACYTKNAIVVEGLAELYSENYSELDSEIRDFILLSKIHLDEPEVFDEYIKHYQETSDPDIKFSLLFAFSSAKLPENIDKLIELLKKPDIIKPQDHLYLYIYLRRNHFAKEKTLDWLFKNWQYLLEISGEKSIEDYPRYTAGTIKTKDESEKFFAFFDRMKDVPVLKRTLKVAEGEISSRLQLIELDQAAVLKSLK